MKKIDLGRTISVLANIGVIAGIVFLAAEIQQSNRIAIASAEVDIRSLMSEVNESIYAVPGMAALRVKLRDPDADLDAEELERIAGYMNRLANAWMAIEIAHDNQLLPASTFSLVEDDIRYFIARFPATGPIWRELVESYPNDQVLG